MALKKVVPVYLQNEERLDSDPLICSDCQCLECLARCLTHRYLHWEVKTCSCPPCSGAVLCHRCSRLLVKVQAPGSTAPLVRRLGFDRRLWETLMARP